MITQRLRDYCEAEFENIDAVLAELLSILETGRMDYSIAELASVATFIHNCYNGMENVLKRVLSSRRIETRDSPTWHKDLLKASLDAGIIAEDLYDTLMSYLSFRHFFVHAYAFSLRWEDLKPLAEDAEGTAKRLKSAVSDYLESR